MRLSELQTGQTAYITRVLGHGAFRKRMIEMGFVRGREVKVLLHAPLKDPIKYEIMGYEVALRTSEAEMVEVVPADDTTQIGHDKIDRDTSTLEEEADFSNPQEKIHTLSHTIRVAFIGNPNCGKTSLFNAASGAKEHVGNYSGVTVDAKFGKMKYRGYNFQIVDLPGTYSLASYSPEELYVRDYLRTQTPDVIVNVVDSSNLERNLYLTTELIDMDRSMVIALNMYDELRSSGAILDYEGLGGMIGVPIVPTVSKTGEGVHQLFDTVIDVYERRDPRVRHIHVSLGHDIEQAITILKDRLKAEDDIDRNFSPRYIAIKLLEHDKEAEGLLHNLKDRDEILALRDKLVNKLDVIGAEDLTSAIANHKYGFIAGALKEMMTPGKETTHESTRFIDSIVTNKLLGFPLFFLVMFFIFWATFALGQYPMDWIEQLVDWLSGVTQKILPEGTFKDLICDGIIGGVGSVIVFLPNILILYFCISFMEDSGYMSRAAFIMDKVMHRIGLHGKSFIPLVMGFGCNVPAVMSARSIESRSSRIITVLINPFMSCSARLPIYVLMIGTFFSTASAPFVFISVYLIGILVAVITAKLMRRFAFRKDETPFVMELPPYRIPTLKALLRHTWGKGEQYLKKMGGIILVACIIVWFLDYYPRPKEVEVVKEQTIAQTKVSPTIQADPRYASTQSESEESSESIQSAENAENQASETITPDSVEVVEEVAGEIDGNPVVTESSPEVYPQDSYLRMIGKAITPVMEPLGFHWQGTVAALAGVPAKEIVVSTLGVLYTNDEATDDNTLGAKLKTPNPLTGRPDFDMASAMAFMVFILLYCPCIATFTAISRECGSWKYGIFSAVYNTAVAWVVGFIVYNAINFFS